MTLKKAFDCVQHSILLKKLLFCGVSDVALLTFLASRTRYITINGVWSDLQHIRYGVPQRSILGPILLLLYISGIVNIHGSSNIVLYADDTNIFFSGVDIHNLFGSAKKRTGLMWLKGALKSFLRKVVFGLILLKIS